MNSISTIAALGVPLIPNVNVDDGEAPAEVFVLTTKEGDDEASGAAEAKSGRPGGIVMTAAVGSLVVGAGESRTPSFDFRLLCLVIVF